MRIENWEKVWHAREQAVWTMRSEGLSYDQIAEFYGISVAKIEKIGEQAIKRLGDPRAGPHPPNADSGR